MFQSPPEWLVWVGSIAGIIALLLGVVMLPTAFQMFWGRSSLNTRFEPGVKGNQRWLQVFLENRPIQKRWLKKLGVRRETIQSLEVSFRLAEAGSGKIIVPMRHPRIYTNDAGDTLGRFRVSLPATYSVAANVMIVYWDEKMGAVAIPPTTEDEEPLPKVEQGYYQVDMKLLVDGQSITKVRRFSVGRTPDDLMWTP